VQTEDWRTMHAGRSECDAQRLSDGRLRLVEHFAWSIRRGSGFNVFDEVRCFGF
jgi:hypothetical protein